MDQADYESLRLYFLARIEKVLDRKIELAYTVHTIFTGVKRLNDIAYNLSNTKNKLNKAIHINYLSNDALNVKRVIKRILQLNN